MFADMLVLVVLFILVVRFNSALELRLLALPFSFLRLSKLATDHAKETSQKSNYIQDTVYKKIILTFDHIC